MKFRLSSTYQYGYRTVNIRDMNHQLISTVSQPKGGLRDIHFYHKEGFIEILTEDKILDQLTCLSLSCQSESLDYEVLNMTYRVSQSFNFYWHAPATLNKISGVIVE